MLQPLQSSVPSLTVQWVAAVWLNTSFSFSEPFCLSLKSHQSRQSHRRLQEKLKHIKLSEFGRFRHLKACYLQDDGAGNRGSSLKRKRSLGWRKSNDACRQLETVESVTGKLQNADIATYVPTVRESIPEWSVRRRIETAGNICAPDLHRTYLGDTTNTISPSAHIPSLQIRSPAIWTENRPPSILFVTTQIYSKLYIISISRSFPSFLWAPKPILCTSVITGLHEGFWPGAERGWIPLPQWATTPTEKWLWARIHAFSAWKGNGGQSFSNVWPLSFLDECCACPCCAQVTDMHTMPIRSESNQMNTIKQKDLNVRRSRSTHPLGPPKCKRNMKYDEIRRNMICVRCPYTVQGVRAGVGHANAANEVRVRTRFCSQDFKYENKDTVWVEHSRSETDAVWNVGRTPSSSLDSS